MPPWRSLCGRRRGEGTLPAPGRTAAEPRGGRCMRGPRRQTATAYGRDIGGTAWTGVTGSRGNDSKRSTDGRGIKGWIMPGKWTSRQTATIPDMQEYPLLQTQYY